MIFPVMIVTNLNKIVLISVIDLFTSRRLKLKILQYSRDTTAVEINITAEIANKRKRRPFLSCHRFIYSIIYYF